MVEMELVAVRIELPGNAPVVLLREVAGSNRLLPIFIGQPEATAIAFSVDGVVTPRPMTHDLLRDVIEALGGTVERVVITELRDGTFYADIHLQVDEEPHVVSSRPSDAIALALRVGCTLYADEEVLDTAGLVEPAEEEESEEVVEQFRAFIDTVDPEDFAS